ncbi:Ectoine hydroxylase-related dioxygenase, phytanoyl-CoA dioxygenase (PhyH) family [Thermomonospora echinospora]|uniref:Ectoine hydroxylase-related dioxygenase, phytanoyl-CoA dioxygenase (PhyH) family n=1 Tax=Thermomonospora echinospora TaxID=1992 RepID=A0A1H5TRN3_9ACTN|nr:phytanoyl-CoA dioxygenase family protein [Thermomonospora echinospora]SEF65410.1 Ectoine hydroxylase-related dioxygenase, phytanoyl-CoA dioxygenase (PhyH) family [Thermomonospora echinospora]
MLSTAETLSPETVAGYRRDGFVHVPRVLHAAEIEEFLSDALDVLAAEEKTRWGEDGATVLDFVENSQLKSEAMRRLALHPRITGVAERLAGAPLRLFKSELLRKSGGSRPTEAHFDEFALPFSGAEVGLTAWVALVDVPMERGCLTFVPGSHRLPPSERAADAWDAYGREEVRWMPRVAVPVRAGDCTFHHTRVVHAAGGNATDRTRISVATVYMDAAAVFRPTGNEHIDGLAGGGEPVAGQPLQGERFPLVGEGHSP